MAKKKLAPPFVPIVYPPVERQGNVCPICKEQTVEFLTAMIPGSGTTRYGSYLYSAEALNTSVAHENKDDCIKYLASIVSQFSDFMFRVEDLENRLNRI